MGIIEKSLSDNSERDFLFSNTLIDINLKSNTISLTFNKLKNIFIKNVID